MLEYDEDSTHVADIARWHRLGTKEEIELYEELSIALELMKNETFDVVGSCICNGIDFNIVTPYPNGLPENVGMLFFNIRPEFEVKCLEMTDIVDNKERKFQIQIKKR